LEFFLISLISIKIKNKIMTIYSIFIRFALVCNSNNEYSLYFF